jgi:hypothetical protein
MIEREGKSLEALAQSCSKRGAHVCHVPGTSSLAKQCVVQPLVLRDMFEELDSRLWRGLGFYDVVEEFLPGIRCWQYIEVVQKVLMQRANFDEYSLTSIFIAGILMEQRFHLS